MENKTIKPVQITECTLCSTGAIHYYPNGNCIPQGRLDGLTVCLYRYGTAVETCEKRRLELENGADSKNSPIGAGE
jgi:hypothetical protein